MMKNNINICNANSIHATKRWYYSYYYYYYFVCPCYLRKAEKLSKNYKTLGASRLIKKLCWKVIIIIIIIIITITIVIITITIVIIINDNLYSAVYIRSTYRRWYW